eukprot:m.26621 g.26621  ORF g.26621 m.26621 type:complete len:277 (+) comp7815_c0_seq1:199-1029(+)
MASRVAWSCIRLQSSSATRFTRSVRVKYTVRYMAGHSQWANRKHQKDRIDFQRSKKWAQMTKKIRAAIKTGGPDLDSNSRLKAAVQDAKKEGVPKANIEKALRSFESSTASDPHILEATGPGGANLLIVTNIDSSRPVNCLEVIEVRRQINRRGGQVGEPGSVAWNFEKKGVVVLNREDIENTELDPEEMAIESNADDVEIEGNECLFYCEQSLLDQVSLYFKEKNLEPTDENIRYVPQTLSEIDNSEMEKLEKLLQNLSEVEDVDSVFTNVKHMQ